MKLADSALFLPLTGVKVKKAQVFKDGTPVRVVKSKEGLLLELGCVPEEIDYVVELTL